MTAISKIKRSEFATFLNTGSDTEVWSRVGKGVTSQTVAYNPQTVTQTFIDEDNATTNVNSYQKALETPMICYKGEPVFEYVDGLRKANALGSELETDVMLVNIYDGDATGGYSAEKSKAIIVIGEFGGDGGSDVQLSFTIQINGNATLGKCKIASGTATFTANA